MISIDEFNSATMNPSHLQLPENPGHANNKRDNSQSFPQESPNAIGSIKLCQTSELSSSDDEASQHVAVKNAINDSPDTPNSGQKREVVCEKWTQCTDFLHDKVVSFVVSVSVLAARNPKRCIYSIIFVSLTLVVTGLFTNFNIEVDEKVLYAPFSSIPQEHWRWVKQESGFVDTVRPTTLILHNDGENIMGIEEMNLVFKALDTVRNTSGYADVCEDGAYWDGYRKEFTCRIVSVTRTWYHDVDLFHSQVKSQQDLANALSLSEYPGGARKDPEFVMGDLQYEDDSTTVSYVPAFFVSILLSGKGEQTEEFETRVIENLLALREQWNAEGSKIRLEFVAERSFADEFQRAIARDMYLVPVIGFLMAAFTCLVFYRKDRIQSRCLLGVLSVVTITMSLCSGFGLLFICGVPFSSMTQLLVFIIYGVGLDDTFIIMGAYLRTDDTLDPVERVRVTMQEVGPSITATTVTTSTAFLLGLLSSVPAIIWLCLYAFPTIAIVFMYQITLFVGFLVLDERRIRAKRKDCCCTCCPDSAALMGAGNDHDDPLDTGNSSTESREKHIADKVMASYSKLLMLPVVKIAVVIVFAAFFVLCTFQTTLLTQEFDVKKLLPEGSYATATLIAMDDYQEKTFPVQITFRDVDQSDPVIQKQMIDFVQDLAAMPAFGEEPPFCWVRDFQELKESEEYSLLTDLSFNEQVAFALSQPEIKEVYGGDIVLDEDGNIKSSRCTILVTNTYVDFVQPTIELLLDQREVTNEQPINQGRKREAFFAFSELYLLWEFYSIAVDELISTTISSVLAVNVIAFIFVPHWSAVLILIPTISVIFIDMMGVLQMAGLHINAVTYVCLVISIGLIVDFLMHILLRYFECSSKSREKRVVETLETMGSSIMLGGLSTLLGALPLVLSTSTILRTVFTCFCSMVVLGVSHGLVLLPVVLSVVGPIPGGGEHTPKDAHREERTSHCDSSTDLTEEKSPRRSLATPSKGEQQAKDKKFIMWCAQKMAHTNYPKDEHGAMREEEELIDYYWMIYQSTPFPEAFLEQLEQQLEQRLMVKTEVEC